MAEQIGPIVARERLSLRLQQLRADSGLSTSDVATAMEWSPSKLSRIEKSDVTVQPLEVRALLAFYGVHDGSEVESLVDLARTSRTRQWYSRHKLNGDYQKYVAFEAEASRINIWQVLFIPGLLQTPEYARAASSLATRKSADHEDVEARVDLRLDRQRALLKRQRGAAPPRLIAVIDESALRRPIGGSDIFVRQLDHLLEAGKDTTANTLAVMPLGLARNPGLAGTFELLQFDGTHPDVLFVEAAASTDDLRRDRATTKFFRDVMAELLDVSLTGEAALDLIRGIRTSFAA
jgi:transcriptional regulator with XRE-family HTH domain